MEETNISGWSRNDSGSNNNEIELDGDGCWMVFSEPPATEQRRPSIAAGEFLKIVALIFFFK